ncbi:shikimate dehydrogenase [Corynebacterium sp. A21]|uniref:shikimate dehydrogenase n=1 Tax=Corynebacterium sp. A21 TaxID=3457318 RepID=UPI003FCF8E25
MSKDSILLGLIGDGIAQSRTPAMHEAEGLAHGAATVYRRLDTATPTLHSMPLPQILEAVKNLGFNGLNITHPHKQAVLPLLDEVSEQARALGAVNTVVISAEGTLSGHNTDVTGYARGFREGLADVAKNTVVQVGAGGAGNAVAYALVSNGVKKLLVADLDLARAQELAASINAAIGREAVEGVSAEGVEQLIAEADGVVNATPMGMLAHPGTAFDTACLTPRHWVSDVVYVPLETQLLAAARVLGCATLDGSRMAVYQAVDAFEHFTGWEADPQRMRETFLSLG